MASRALVEIIMRVRGNAAGVLRDMDVRAVRLGTTMRSLQSTVAGASREFNRLSGATFAIEVAEREAEEAARRLEERQRALDRTFLAVGTAALAASTSMVLVAARTEELGLITERMGETHGYAAATLGLLEQQIESLGITTQGARLILTQFMGSQLQLRKSTQLARAAQDLATLAIVDSSEAAADLTFAVASLQPRLLRKYRIYISLVDVYRKAAQELGKTVVALTDEERQLAFLNAVLEEAADYTGLYEEKMKTAAGQMRSLKRETQELAEELGSSLIPTLYGAVAAVRDLGQAIADLPDPGQSRLAQIISIVGVTTALKLAAKGLDVTLRTQVAAGLATVAIELLSVYGETQRVALSIKQFNEEAIKSSKTQEEYTRKMEEYIEETVMAANVTDDLRRVMIKMARASIVNTVEREKLNRVLNYTLPTFQKWQVELFDWTKAWDEVTEAQGAVMVSVQELQATYWRAWSSMAQFFTDAEVAAKDHAGELLTIQREKAYVESEIAKKGATEKLVARLEGLQKEEHAAEAAGERMARQQERQLGMMLMQAAQAAGMSMDFLREISIHYGVATREAWAEAGRFVSEIEAARLGAITEGQAFWRMTGAISPELPLLPDVEGIAGGFENALSGALATQTIASESVSVSGKTINLSADSVIVQGGAGGVVSPRHPDFVHGLTNELRFEGVVTR